jgi:hypothetical protein
MTPRWEPPPEGWCCLNVDAALFPGENRMGWRAVLRDHTGKFLSCSEGMQGLHVPELPEALGVRCSITMVRARGFLKIVVVVSDCLSLMQRSPSSVQDRSVISDIKNVTADFQSCLFKFSPRSSNVVAHKLSRTAEPVVLSVVNFVMMCSNQ